MSFQAVRTHASELTFQPCLEEERREQKIDNDVIRFVDQFNKREVPADHWSKKSSQQILDELPY